MATKSDIVAKVAKRHPFLDKIVIATIVDRFFQIFLDTLKHHDRVEIKGFGSFSIRSYNLNKPDYPTLPRFTRSKYFKPYFRSSEKLSNLINE